VKEPRRRTPRSPVPVSRRPELESKPRKAASNEVMEWLDGVSADPALAGAVEERLAEMRAEQRRESRRARELSRQGLSDPKRDSIQAEVNAKSDDLIESMSGRVSSNRRRAKGAPKRRPG
jgi:hypothetical protein